MEEIVAGHAAVAECAVVGIEDPDKGQVPAGLVVLVHLLAFVQLVVKGGGAASLDHVIVRLVPALQLEGMTAAPAAT